jgi:thymidine phosphorylase
MAAWRLGAGRARKEDPVSSGAGVVLRVKPGDRVRAGDPLLELRTDEGARIAAARADAEGAITVGPDAPGPAPLLLDRIA